MDFQRFGSGAYIASRKSIKGLILIGWISFLIYVAILASTGDISCRLMDFQTDQKKNISELIDLNRKNISAFDFLEDYKNNRQGKSIVGDAPIIPLLNEIFTDQVKWYDLDISEFHKDSTDLLSLNKWKKEQYTSLFIQCDNLLYFLIRQKNKAISSIDVPGTFYPTPFMGIASEESSVVISQYFRQWITDRIDLQASHEKRGELINTFFLLLVLGAFGSLIFLIKDFIDKESTVWVEAYLFRPVLGMFLAMGMFILDLLAHSLLSTSGVVDVRIEPLYVLALASGLLSEQAYAIMNIRANAILERAKGQSKKTNTQENQENDEESPDLPTS